MTGRRTVHVDNFAFNGSTGRIHYSGTLTDADGNTVSVSGMTDPGLAFDMTHIVEGYAGIRLLAEPKQTAEERLDDYRKNENFE